MFSFVRDAVGSDQAADNFRFIVSNRKFVQRPNRTGNKKYDLARSHQHDVAAFQTKAGVDNCVASAGWQVESFRVLALIVRGGNTDMKRAGVMRRPPNGINQPG